MRNRRATTPRYLCGLKGLTKADRGRLAHRGIREADQLACLLLSQPELVAKFTAKDTKLTAVWSDSSMRRIHMRSDELSRQIKAHPRCFGIVRRTKKTVSQVALRPNAIAQLLGMQRKQHAGLPAEVDMTASIPYIHDQGVNPSCVGHAATAAVEMHTGETLSGSYVYLQSKRIDGHPDEDGTTLEAGMKALAKNGACKLETWPGVNAEMQSLDALDLPDALAEKEANSFRIVEDKSGPIDSVQEIKTANAYGIDGKGRPVLAAVPVYASWDAAFRTGTVPLRLGEDDTLKGWHAIQITGYKDDAEAPGGGYFLFLNSWGEGWASASPHRAGVGTIPYAYFEENETETYYLEPAVSKNPTIMGSIASRVITTFAIAGLVSLTWLFFQPIEVPPSQASHALGFLAERPLKQIPVSPPPMLQASYSDPYAHDSWETLNAERSRLDHDLANYADHVRREFPEINLALVRGDP